MTNTTTNTGFFSANELDSNVPSTPDTFVPRGPQLQAIRTKSLIAKRLCQAKRFYAACQAKPSTWTFGLTADGQVIGERWSKREINDELQACVIDQHSWASIALLKQELLAWKREHHWQLVNSVPYRRIPARVIPSRFDK